MATFLSSGQIIMEKECNTLGVLNPGMKSMSTEFQETTNLLLTLSKIIK